MAKYLAAVHAQMAGGLGRARPAIDVEQVLEAPIRADAGGEDAAIVAAPKLRLRLQHHRAGAIAEQHAGAAVGPIENARERLGADDDGALELPALEEVVGDRQGVDEARADGLHIEGGALDDAEPVWMRTAVAGKVRSGVAGGADDEVDVERVDAGAHEGLAAAAMPRSEVSSPSAAMWRCSMPVRSWIHSSLVSTMFARSSLVRTRFGRCAPTPRITDRMNATGSPLCIN